MQLIYIITDHEDGQVLIAASSNEKADQQLFDYMGYGDPNHEDDVKYHGFNRHVYSEYADDYVGYYKFESLFPSGYGDEAELEWEIQRFNLYCKQLDANQK